ncbi:hypothetical protein BAE44_0000202 [Dichanthelium oligosanthes]|uniref:Late embryogenesis abundant protein LEA-2 subgroup domain-containing protein n=1 Tax=Dichanthelium oligosanthes TaxID=888268 RepID=A0A1E5WN29_9POAL|nr:hypothetical protein BAE44_0000202 [Dichanthelium oligosanthes]
MADAKPKQSKPKGSTPFAFADATKAKAKAVDASDGKADDGHGVTPPGRGRWVRWACCGLAVAGALAAVVMLALSLTVLKVRDPVLSMESLVVRWFNVHFDARAARPLRINVTLAGSIVIRNPNYESMRFGASYTEIFVDGVDGPVGVGRAPPGEVPTRGASRVTADLDVFVDRVGPAVVGEVLFGSGEVRLATRTAVDGRISVLGGLYGRRTVRVAMRCRVALRVSAAIVVAGNPACVADFGR